MNVSEKDNLIIALEKVNFDYLKIIESKEYRTGKRFYKICDMLKKFQIKRFLYYAKAMQVQKKLVKKLPVCNDKKFVCNAKEESCDSERKINIYSCITGNYDSICEPIYIAPNEEFYMFTDEVEKTIESKWIGRDVKQLGLGEGENINRYCKMHPFQLFETGDFSIYLDGNVQVVSDLNSLCDIAKSARTGIAMHIHHARNCVYDEAVACEILGRGDLKAIKQQMLEYRETGFPEKFGLREATIIVVDLHNSNARRVMESWWEEFKRSGSKRDQLAFPYVVWKLGFEMDDIGYLGDNLLNNPKFRIMDLGAHSFRK